MTGLENLVKYKYGVEEREAPYDFWSYGASQKEDSADSYQGWVGLYPGQTPTDWRGLAP